MMSTLHSRPQAIAASMSSVVGLNPPRSFTASAVSGAGISTRQPFADQLGDGVLEFFVLVHGANLNRANQIIGKIERCFHSRPRFPESWFCCQQWIASQASASREF